MTNLFAINGGIELVAGIAALISPTAMPMWRLCGDRGQEAVRWWGLAIVALGVASLLMRNAPDEEESKAAFAVGMMVYHAIISFFVAARFPEPQFVGGILHIALFFLFHAWVRNYHTSVAAVVVQSY
eukprot:CAMPEP_0119151228 /NCGR_PEP_ID=MMETSP1310-20130426/46058_1 /TAXON_ID=464262 /ORGANISM="Genus nov. species nov., Strain RCC2339" /LENGTH=126 /DNA_ID=CAMNT_0007143487 /DNA_START=59 /DNA_END=439 /DNA_ORIENTATION=+